MKKMKIIPKNKNKIYNLTRIFLNSLIKNNDLDNIVNKIYEFQSEEPYTIENTEFNFKIQDFEDISNIFDILPFYLNDKEKYLEVVFNYLKDNYNDRISCSPTSLARKGSSIKLISNNYTQYVRFYKIT